MNVEPLYQNGDPQADPERKPTTSSAFLQRLISISWWVTWVLVVGFSLTFLASILALAGVEPVQSQLFADIDPVTNMVSSLTMMISAGAFLIILMHLKRICQTLVLGDPFVPENASRLRTIWIVVVVAEVLRLVSGFILSWLYRNNGPAVSDGDMTMTLDLRLYVWFLVFALIILAEVFREGARLRREQKLTI